MKANTTIHEMNIASGTCVVTLYDCEGDLICDHLNIGLEMNADDTINTQAIESKIKKRVLVYQAYKHNPKIS